LVLLMVNLFVVVWRSSHSFAQQAALLSDVADY
jgi:hypothetical protein